MSKDAQGHGSNSRGDGTFDKRTGVQPKTGIMVGRGKGAGKYTGVWTDPKTGQHYVENTNRFREMTLAKSAARQRNQVAIYDIGSRRTIQTGGTGEISAHAQGIDNATRGKNLAGLRR
jgi:hypothetical protein